MSQKQPKQFQQYKAAFDEVIDKYITLKSASVSNSTLKCLDYSKAHESGSNTANVVMVSAIDFVCDVELAARRALKTNKNLWSVFEENYIFCTVEPDTQNIDVDKVRTLVGRSFTESRIFPTAGYFRPQHIDRGKNK